MGRTERRIFVLGSIVLSLALSTCGAAAVPDVPAAVPPPSLRHASPEAFAEQATSGQDLHPALGAEGSVRTALELMVLAATCGIAVALYSAAGGGPGGQRVPSRIRRR